MSGVNLKKLAKELGLSISSVSKALRDSYEISAETKQRVIEMAEKLNYQPNPFARGLRKRKSITIAVVIPEIANNFFSLAIDGMQSVAQQKGYHVLTYLSQEDAGNEESTVRHLQGGRVDGVIISLCADSTCVKHLQALQEGGVPIVFFDRIPDGDFPSITTDDFDSGFKATEHMILNGCRKIAYLRMNGHLSITHKRMNGYLGALKKYNIPQDPKMIIECTNDDNTTNVEIIKKMLRLKNRPDGIFASVEKLAIASYHACNELKIKIPDQIKIISFSNLRTASLLSPSLSTITQPAFEIGKEAATLLIQLIEKKNTGNRIEQIVLKSDLIERNSSRKRAKA